MAHDVFISCTAADKPVGDAICATLEANNIRCWIAPRDIMPGADWGESIIKAIAAAKVMVLVFSAKANASEHIKREVERAVNAGLSIIPVRIEDVMPKGALEYFLSTPHWLDAFTGELAEHLEKLVKVVRAILDQQSDKPVVLPPRKDTPKPPVPPPPPSRSIVAEQKNRTGDGPSKGCFGISVSISIVATLGLALFLFFPSSNRPLPVASSPEISPQMSATPDTQSPPAATPSFAPSFDCSRDRHWDEQAVCHSRALSDFDQQVAALYKAVMASTPDEAGRTVLKHEQRAWLHARADCKTASDPGTCLNDLYVSRIAELSARHPAQ